MKLSRLLLDALETFPNFIIIDKNATIVYLNESYASLLGIRGNRLSTACHRCVPKTRMVEVLKSGKPDIGHLMTLYDHSQKKNVTVACNRMPIFSKWPGHWRCCRNNHAGCPSHSYTTES